MTKTIYAQLTMNRIWVILRQVLSRKGRSGFPNLLMQVRITAPLAALDGVINFVTANRQGLVGSSLLGYAKSDVRRIQTRLLAIA